MHDHACVTIALTAVLDFQALGNVVRFTGTDIDIPRERDHY